VDIVANQAVSRRQMLKMLGLLGGSSALTMAGLGAVEPVLAGTTPQESKPASAHQWFFVIDLRRCDGCNVCMDACQKQHHLPPDQTWINVYKIKSHATGKEYSMPRVCMQCENAPCVKVCPVGASFKSDDGITLVDQDRCIGCRMCMAACPYEARYFNWSDPPKVASTLEKPRPEWPVPQQRGTVGKCVLCVHALRVGKIPACIEACAMEALYVGDLNTDLMTNGVRTFKWSEFTRENHVVRYKEELNTRPRVYYVLGHGEKLEH
jgi:dimethyl sulfoxide reductase iron-sulfur subunit